MKSMKVKSIIWILIAVFAVGACFTACDTVLKEQAYMNITPEEAKELMDTETDYVILDVRTQEEFAEKHIPKAVLLPHYDVMEKAETVIPDKDKLILVYCRSGRRSKIAAEILEELGYTNIKEFGGIIDWKYETVTGNE